jgi:hypothetical protein
MDPSRTGYFEHTPTSIPILRKIDVIEVEQDAFATEIGAPVAADLIPGNSEYVFAAGDGIEVQINDLFQVDKAEQFRRTVDQSGKILLPIVGSIEVGFGQPQQLSVSQDERAPTGAGKLVEDDRTEHRAQGRSGQHADEVEVALGDEVAAERQHDFGGDRREDVLGEHQQHEPEQPEIAQKLRGEVCDCDQGEGCHGARRSRRGAIITQLHKPDL